MLAVKVAFGFCFLFGAFEETVPWTIDLPQVRKYFFEKSLKDKAPEVAERVVYDNIENHSPHFNYEKYREHYADQYEYDGYMEQKVHDAVRNGSAYLEGLRRAIENYTRKLESCRRMNFSVNIFELQPNILNITNPNLTPSNFTNFNPSNFTIDLPTNFTQNFPANFTRSLNTNFTNFMRMSDNSTVFNANDRLRECMRADRASEHVRRLAQLAIWAATELQDKLYADKYEKHGEDHDGTLILKLAWFLDRLAHLTGYDPQPHQFVEPRKSPQPTPTNTVQSLVPGLISNEDLQFLLTCMKRNSSNAATERCAFPPRRVSAENPVNFMNRNYPGPPPYPTDLLPSGSDNHEYTFSEQDYAEENMPLSLPPKPVTAVKTKRKRSVQEDPLQELFKYYVKYKTWIGSNQDIKASAEINDNSLLSNKRVKRFIVKKSNHLKPENPFPNLSNLVKHKIGVHYNKDKEQAKKLKDFFEKLNVKRPSKGKLKLFKAKRSVGYMRKYQPRVPMNPQGDISYYVKNKKGTNYNYNAAQALLVRAGLEQAFQTGNIEVVRRYGSNYNPAVVDQTSVGVLRGLADV